MRTIPLYAGDAGEPPDPREAPLWIDEAAEFWWGAQHPVLVRYTPRMPRFHLQPIEDEL